MLNVAQLNLATFTAYTKAFSINSDNKYVIYAKLTDKVGNVTYISSNGIVLDATAPVITGIENGIDEIALADTVFSKLPPKIIEGKGQSVTAGEKKDLTFRSNAAFGDFIRAQLDGKTLDEKNYTVKECSTVVTLKADYVETLSTGEHTIGIVSEGGTATTSFTVNAKAVVENDTKSPQTGDNSHMALWISLLFVSGGAVATTGVRKSTVKTKN